MAKSKALVSVLNSAKAIKQLMDPKPPPKTRRIGFRTD